MEKREFRIALYDFFLQKNQKDRGVGMRVIITVDIDVEESELEEEFVKNNIVDFTRDLLINGAAEQEVGLSLQEVEYLNI